MVHQPENVFLRFGNEVGGTAYPNDYVEVNNVPNDVTIKIYDHETAGNLVKTSGIPVGGTIEIEGNFLDATKTYYISYNLNSIETKRYEIIRSADVSHEIESEGNVKFLNVPSGATVYIFAQPLPGGIVYSLTNTEDTTKDLTVAYDPRYTYRVGIKEKGKSMGKLVYLD